MTSLKSLAAILICAIVASAATAQTPSVGQLSQQLNTAKDYDRGARFFLTLPLL